jgi:hypothetical protein
MALDLSNTYSSYIACKDVLKKSILTTKKLLPAEKAGMGDVKVADTKSVPVRFWDLGNAYEQFSEAAQWSPWDTCLMGGIRMPGLVRVRSRKRRKLLTAGGIGTQREELVDTGAEASQVEFVCTMWMPDHLTAYGALAKLIELLSGTRQKPKAVTVYHPGLRLLNITSVYVTAVGVPEPHGSSGGAYVATIEAQEFKPVLKGKGGKDAGVWAVDPNNAKQQAALSPKLAGIQKPSTDPSQTKP